MCMRHWFFKLLGALLWEKWEFKFLLASMKTLTNFGRSLLKLSSKCLLLHSESHLWFCKLFRKPEMMVKNSKIFKAGFGITFQNHRQMIQCWLFQRLN
jgi:hypothetical protein